jgi:hypothetical protein
MRTLSNTRPAAPSLAFLAALALLCLPQGARAQAPPALPATFFGTVEVEGKPAPDGARVRAFVGGKNCTQGDAARAFRDDDGLTRYVITVVHDTQVAGCGIDGAIVEFTVDGAPATPSATWFGRPQEVNLSAARPPSASPPSEDSPTAAPAATSANSLISPGGGGPGVLVWGVLVAAGAAVAAGLALAVRRKFRERA